MSKIKRYGIRSAIFTILHFEQASLRSKEAVKQQHIEARQELKNRLNNCGKNWIFERILSEDLELFYTSLQNSERQPKAELAYFFSTKKLTDEELTLLENRNKDYLNTFRRYGFDDRFIQWDRPRSLFNDDMKDIKKSSDPDSIFCLSYGHRETIALHVIFQSMDEETKKRVANKDPSDIKLKKQRV